MAQLHKEGLRQSIMIFRIFLLGNLIFLMAACGVKPSFVDAPEDVAQDSFPRTYPNLETDPAP